MKKFIPDCYWPSSSHGQYVSHEAICVLNTHTVPARLRLTLYFEDREKISDIEIVIQPERTLHIRMDQLKDGGGSALVPKDTPYAVMLECDQDVCVQYTRVDTAQPELALMTTLV